ncbi:phage holin family protein [Leifsonia sp. NPDC058194]|uniref:phage holin family protein n=1 Tax=Leifsonia sp. NPDC058194 TaxID=3346374 RepID=UPI0036DE0D6D
MVRFLIRVAIFVVTAALGLLVAAWLLPGFHLDWEGGIIAVVVFAIAQSVLSPFIFNLARKHASAVLGGIGLVSTLVALIVAALFPGGIRVDDFVTWALAALIVWFVTALGGWLLPLLFLKKKVTAARA